MAQERKAFFREWIRKNVNEPRQDPQFLGIDFTMIDYMKEIFAAFDKAEPKGGGTKTSAAPDNLFKVGEDCKKLKPPKAKEFHNLVAQTLYATKRARPDTCTAVAFLTTRVREPDKDDWTKMVHMMKYIRGTRKLPLILSANGTGILKWIDGLFGVHPNMRGHTGGGLSMGRGFPITNCTKQKINTRSSTETEIVSVDDCMPAVCWSRYFMLAQGYGINGNIVYQDNKSAILMEKNGKASSSKRTKHINIRYYFITDRISKNELAVKWCPTGDMIGDYMTKPNQGALFTKFRDQLMGVVPAKGPGPGNIRKDTKNDQKDQNFFTKQRLVQRATGGKLDHRSVLDGEHKRASKRTTDERRRTGGKSPKKTKERSSDTKTLNQDPQTHPLPNLSAAISVQMSSSGIEGAPANQTTVVIGTGVGFPGRASLLFQKFPPHSGSNHGPTTS